MKLLNKTYIVFFIIVFITSCNNIYEERNPQFLTSIDIKIPVELIENIETVDFFESTEIAINEYSDNIEKMVLNGKHILLEDPVNLSELDKKKLGLMNIQYVSNTTQMQSILQDTQKYIKNAKINGFDASQIKSLKRIEEILKNRIADINNKYKKYFK
ncbi:MAG: hypothetical protein L3J34_03950 [Flavobacteriaceae bacterium]|nr:hypothetical protein [Flavobacteriaceae bacterium]